MASRSGAGEGYKPEFQEELKESLVDLSWTDSTELWLIQWPKKHNPDFDGKEVVLNLHQDGKLASFQGSSGREYDVVSFAAQEPNATVFLSSASGTKIVGKISRRVSLVHYPEPNEVEKINSGNWKQLYQESASLTKSSRRSTLMHGNTPAQSIYPTKKNTLAQSRWQRHQSVSGHVAASPSSKQKSTLSEDGEPSKSSKRRVPERTVSVNQSADDSGGRVNSAVTSSGSSQHSHQGKVKRKKTKD